MKRLIILFALILIVANCSALTFYSAECSRDGRVRIVLNSFDHEDDKVYTNTIKTKIGGVNINNNWSRNYLQRSNDAARQYGVLETDEAIFNELKTYKIHISYENEEREIKEIDASVNCLGLRFSCRLLDMGIDDCYTEDNYFNAFLTVKGLSQSAVADLTVEEGLDFTLEAEGRYEDYNGIIKNTGELPIGYNIEKISDGVYKIKAPFMDNKVNKFYARFDSKALYQPCDYTNYPEQTFFDFKECYEKTEEGVVEEESVVEEEVIEEITEEDEPEKEMNVETELNKKNFIIFASIIIMAVILGYMLFFVFKKKGHL